MKFCKRCECSKNEEDFHKNKAAKDGLNAYCKSCTNLSRRNYRSKLENEGTLKFIKRRERFKALYGVLLDGYDSLEEPLDNKCEICGEAEKAGRSLPLDHDHKTGRLRGFLCFRCNTVLGKVKDSTEILQNMISYLL